MKKIKYGSLPTADETTNHFGATAFVVCGKIGILMNEQEALKYGFSFSSPDDDGEMLVDEETVLATTGKSVDDFIKETKEAK